MKKFYHVREMVWAKKLKMKVMVQELDIDNLEAKVSHFDDKGELIYETIKFEDLDKLKTAGKKEETPKLTILIKYFDGNEHELKKIEKGDWIDLRSAETVEYKAGDFIKLPLGVAMSLPFEYEANVLPRSSTFKNFGVVQTNSMGVIDESYRGNDDQWFAPLLAMRDGRIEKGDRVCQFRIVEKMPKVNLITVPELKYQNRGGHGTTGVK